MLRGGVMAGTIQGLDNAQGERENVELSYNAQTERTVLHFQEGGSTIPSMPLSPSGPPPTPPLMYAQARIKENLNTH